jgi:hypothetical protein
MDEFFQDADPTAVAHLLQAGKDDFAIGAMVLRHPLRDLLFERIKLGGPRWTWFRDHGFRVVQVLAHSRPRDLQFLSNFLHGLPFNVKIVYG